MASTAGGSVSLPVAMQSVLLHKQVCVQLLNGLTITGRVVQLEADTMNMRLDSLTTTQVRRRTSDGQWAAVDNPPQLPPMHSIALRGNFVKCIDVVDRPAADAVERAIRLVRAGGLAKEDELDG